MRLNNAVPINNKKLKKNVLLIIEYIWYDSSELIIIIIYDQWVSASTNEWMNENLFSNLYKHVRKKVFVNREIANEKWI